MWYRDALNLQNIQNRQVDARMVTLFSQNLTLLADVSNALLCRNQDI